MPVENGTKGWSEEAGREVIGAVQDMPGAMLPALHALQERFGYVHEEAIPLLADALNVSKAEVVGVIHFYHDFRTEPGGRHVLKVCRAEACQAMGCETLVEHLQENLRTEIGQTTPDGRLTIESVYCLGNCALSPAVMLDGRLYGRVTAGRAEELLAGVRD